MKNKAGIISGFVLGLAGCLLLFQFIFLDKIPPEDEIAPGVVLIATIMNGMLFAFIGYYIQNYLRKKRN